MAKIFSEALNSGTQVVISLEPTVCTRNSKRVVQPLMSFCLYLTKFTVGVSCEWKLRSCTPNNFALMETSLKVPVIFFEVAINFVLRKSLKISVRERQMFD